MNGLPLQKLITLELMALTGVLRCVSVRGYYAPTDQHVIRWFGGGKTVSLSPPLEVNHEDALRYAVAGFEAWKRTEAGSDDEAEYDRLKRGSDGAGIGWMEFKFDGSEEQHSSWRRALNK